MEKQREECVGIQPPPPRWLQGLWCFWIKTHLTSPPCACVQVKRWSLTETSTNFQVGLTHTSTVDDWENKSWWIPASVYWHKHTAEWFYSETWQWGPLGSKLCKFCQQRVNTRFPADVPAQTSLYEKKKANIELKGQKLVMIPPSRQGNTGFVTFSNRAISSLHPVSIEGQSGEVHVAHVSLSLKQRRDNHLLWKVSKVQLFTLSAHLFWNFLHSIYNELFEKCLH